MRGFYGFRWVEDPFVCAIDKRQDRQWLLATLQDSYLRLRDAYALTILQQCLTGRSDVRYRYVTAWMSRDDDEPRPPGDRPLLPGEDVVFLGRPKPFGWSPRFGSCAQQIERLMCGRIIDREDGRTGDTICYGNRRFTRLPHDSSTEHDRCYDPDYGVLLYRTLEIDGERRQVIALAGLGRLATLLLVVVLAHPRLRRELARQARRIAPLKAGRHRPEEWIEALIRFKLHDASKFRNLHNTLEESLRCPRSEESTFPFESQLEVVAVSTGAGGREIRFNDASELAGIALELQPSGGRRGGRLGRIDNGRWVDLPHLRFVLLRELVLHPDSSPERLCAVLERERLRGETPEDPDGALRKLVHDLNKDLKPLVGSRPVQKSLRLQRYVLVGVRVEITERVLV